MYVLINDNFTPLIRIPATNKKGGEKNALGSSLEG